MKRQYRKSDYIRPCSGKCNRLTRPPWMAKHLAPDTIQRATSTECHSCYRARQREEGTLPPPRPRGRPWPSTKARGSSSTPAEVNAAHNAFLAGRNERLARQNRKRLTV